MSKLSTYNKRYSSTDATAVSSDIVTGKTAWANDSEISGSAYAAPLSNYPHVDGSPRTLFEWYSPVGATTNPYYITADDCMVIAPSASIVGGYSGRLDSTGYIYSKSGAWDEWLRIDSLAAKSTSERVYEMWGKVENPAVNEAGVRILFNFADYSNFWECRMLWFGSRIRAYLDETAGGVFSFRGSAGDLSTSVVGPLTWFLSVHDCGDSVKVFFGAHTSNSGVLSDATVTTYYTPNRAQKNTTNVRFAQGGHISNFKTGGVRIRDVSW